MARRVMIMFSAPLLVLILVNATAGAHYKCEQEWYNYKNEDGSIQCLYPWKVEELPQEPRENFYRDMRSCINTLTPTCNKQLFDYIFDKQKIQKSCCHRLANMAPGCLKSFSWMLAHTSRYESYEGHITQGTEAASRSCDKAVGDYGWY